MMRGMYSAISGLRNHQIMLDVTANDLANVNTVGFKASRTSFRDSLAQMQRSGASATTGAAAAGTSPPSGGGPAPPAGFLSRPGFPNGWGRHRTPATRGKAPGSSGAPADGTPGVNGLGQTVGGQLEMSNVDLATEF